MLKHTVTQDHINSFRLHLVRAEKSLSTISKYIHDVSAFFQMVNDAPVTQETLIEYKQSLINQYQPTSVNSMLAALNHFFKWMGWELHVKALKIQRKVFCEEEKELSKEEYERLLQEAQRRGNTRLYLLMQTLASTGIRVSELRYITVEAVRKGRADIQCKGKNRVILIPSSLRKLLLTYTKEQKQKEGQIFVTKTGRSLNRSNIWRMLRSLCKGAGVDEAKVFPHNFRHLFARVFYKATKDIVKLADILGHSSISTTRIYMTSSGQEHAALLDSLGLIHPQVT